MDSACNACHVRRIQYNAIGIFSCLSSFDGACSSASGNRLRRTAFGIADGRFAASIGLKASISAAQIQVRHVNDNVAINAPHHFVSSLYPSNMLAYRCKEFLDLLRIPAILSTTLTQKLTKGEVGCEGAFKVKPHCVRTIFLLCRHGP